MVGRMSLTAFAASALLLAGGQSAAFAADDDGIPFEQLVQVYVPDQDAVDSVVSNYDAAEYKSVQDDGSILLNVFVTAEEKAALASQGLQDRPRHRGLQHRCAAHEGAPGDHRPGGRSPPTSPRTASRARSSTASPSSPARATRSSSAPWSSRTPSAPNAGRTTARFLYVEAFNKSTKRVAGSTNTFTGPALALSYAGPDGVYSTPVNMGRFIDTDPTPDEYMYHRQLIRLTGAYANLTAKDIQLRVATAATAGGAEASTETFPVTEWLGKDLPPHVAGFKTEFFTHYQDPTETRANLDALAAQYPELMSVVNMPEKTSGYQRKSQAIMNGTTAHRLGSARPPSARCCSTPRARSRPRSRSPRSRSPVPPGRAVRAIVDGIPGGSTDFILTLKDPAGNVLQSIDTGTSPETVTRCSHGRHRTPTRSRASRATSATSRSRSRRSLSHGGRAHRQGLGPGRRQPGHGRVPQPGRGNNQPLQHRGQRQADRGLPGHGRHRRARPRRPSRSSTRSTPSRRPPRSSRRRPTAATRAPASSQARARTNLSDFLNAPASVARGPFQQHLYRIGAHRDGSKVGVFLFCQQHAREWTTSLTCQETAHELVENYATDPQTKQLLDNVEVFISPNSNPDGAHYSMYDASVAAQDDGQLLPRDGQAPTRPRVQRGAST